VHTSLFALLFQLSLNHFSLLGCVHPFEGVMHIYSCLFEKRFERSSFLVVARTIERWVFFFLPFAISPSVSVCFFKTFKKTVSKPAQIPLGFFFFHCLWGQRELLLLFRDVHEMRHWAAKIYWSLTRIASRLVSTLKPLTQCCSDRPRVSAGSWGRAALFDAWWDRGEGGLVSRERGWTFRPAPPFHLYFP